MRHVKRIAAWTAAALIALPIAVLAIVLLGGNTAPGRRLIAHLLGAASGGELRVTGLAGRFPDRLRAAQLDISDKKGVWARVDGLQIDWSPLSLWRGVARIDRLTARHVVVLRRPVLAGGAATLPALLAVDQIRINRLDLAAPVAGVPAAFALRARLRLASFNAGSITLALRRLDGTGRYRLAGSFDPAALALDLTIGEAARGFVADLAGLPDLGALAITARLDGPPAAARTRLAIAAGPLRLRAAGRIDLVRDRADLSLSGAAPAMSPRPGLSWNSASLVASLHGKLTRPQARGHLAIDGLAAAGGMIGHLRADLTGDAGRLDVTAIVSDLRVPGPRPDLFAAAPLVLHAEARLDQKRRPVAFALSHPLFAITGRADAGTAFTGAATLTLPALAPLSAAAGIDLRGHAAVTAWFSAAAHETKISASGAAHLSGGLPAALALLGDNPSFHLATTAQGGTVTFAHARLDGRDFHIAAAGRDKAGALDIGWRSALTDLSALDAKLAGSLAATGRVRGPHGNFTLTAGLDGRLGLKGAAPQPFTAQLRAVGLPTAPTVRIGAEGKFAGAPLLFAADLRRESDDTLGLTSARARWKSAALGGELSLSPGAPQPLGHLRLRLTRLADLAPLFGVRLAGAAAGTLDLATVQGKPRARLALTARRLGIAGIAADRLTLAGTIGGSWGRPDLSLRLALDGIAAHGIAGNARLTASGPAAAPAWRLTTALRTKAGMAVPFAASGTVRLAPGEVRLAALDTGYGGEIWHLLAPARIGWARGIAIDGLRLGNGAAVLSATGRVTPKLALAVALRNVGLALAKPLLPVPDAAGRLAITATLRGNIKAPEGIIRMTGRGLRLGNGAMPVADLPADLDLTARLAHGAARLDADLAAGHAIRLRLAGAVPLRASGRLALSAAGTLDLAFLDPLLTASGRTLRGRLSIAAALAGTPAAPRATGTIRLADGEFQDFTQGIRLTDIGGLVDLAGETLRLRRITARAGTGTIALAGTVQFARGLPVDLAITAKHARALAGGLLTATADAALTLRGQAAGRLDLAGHITIDRAEINIPNELPQDIPVLAIRRPGQQTRPAPPSRTIIGLALDIAAPGYVRVRGRGLEAELGGRLHIGGTMATPQISGGFSLRRGSINLAGQTLTFTTGTLGFDGRSLSGRLDPLLDFEAQSNINGTTATLRVSGYADTPKITLSSAPPLPQDEILAQLLFGQSTKQLNPLQIAQIGQSLAVLGGISGLDPLMAVRRHLGLDRLSVGGGTGKGNGVALEAGKYVTNRVYLGAKQVISGGTQAQVQIDLTKHLKLDANLGTGGSIPTTAITPANDPGSNLGLTYQFEY